VLKFRSVSSIVIPPAKTGRERIRRTTVITMDQAKRGNRSKVIPGPRMLNVVVRKLILAMIEETPAKCRAKIAKSTLPPV